MSYYSGYQPQSSSTRSSGPSDRRTVETLMSAVSLFEPPLRPVSLRILPKDSKPKSRRRRPTVMTGGGPVDAEEFWEAAMEALEHAKEQTERWRSFWRNQKTVAGLLRDRTREEMREWYLRSQEEAAFQTRGQLNEEQQRSYISRYAAEMEWLDLWRYTRGLQTVYLSEETTKKYLKDPRRLQTLEL
ncbi:hypothetical protein DENSPDRAFT_874908 [Dentipellis sp. KUC8613]|nr:hypothetical protein DENSPDRAFT_874908 [Dentipellis sp. KUC8613]